MLLIKVCPDHVLDYHLQQASYEDFHGYDYSEADGDNENADRI